MFEVRFHGRGGQGAVMAAQALASAAVIEGQYAVAFPFFGAERRGAPVLAFARVDKNHIYGKTQVYEPDYIVVLDDRLIELVNVLQGLKPNAVAIVNSTNKPEEIDLGREMKAGTVDATTIALEILGAPITNSAILGAFAKTTEEIKIESIEEGIKDIFGRRIGEELGVKNAKAARKAYDQTVVGTCKGEKQYEEVKKWLPTYKELPLGAATPPMDTYAGKVGPGSFIENKTGSWRTFRPEYDQDKCNMCLFCWFYCPDGCITREEDKIIIDYDYCKGCGICANECPKDAIEMVRGD